MSDPRTRPRPEPQPDPDRIAGSLTRETVFVKRDGTLSAEAFDFLHRMLRPMWTSENLQGRLREMAQWQQTASANIANMAGELTTLQTRLANLEKGKQDE